MHDGVLADLERSWERRGASCPKEPILAGAAAWKIIEYTPNGRTRSKSPYQTPSTHPVLTRLRCTTARRARAGAGPRSESA